MHRSEHPPEELASAVARGNKPRRPRCTCHALFRLCACAFLLDRGAAFLADRLRWLGADGFFIGVEPSVSMLRLRASMRLMTLPRGRSSGASMRSPERHGRERRSKSDAIGGDVDIVHTARAASGWIGRRVRLEPTGKRRVSTPHASSRQSIAGALTRRHAADSQRRRTGREQFGGVESDFPHRMACSDMRSPRHPSHCGEVFRQKML